MADLIEEITLDLMIKRLNETKVIYFNFWGEVSERKVHKATHLNVEYYDAGYMYIEPTCRIDKIDTTDGYEQVRFASSPEMMESLLKTIKNNKNMEDYLKAIEKWESEFNCNCGEDTFENFTYDRSVSNGEIWTCCNCCLDLVVSKQPNEDNF
jgi:hypothetical protein